jgi:hypothetical protein
MKTIRKGAYQMSKGDARKEAGVNLSVRVSHRDLSREMKSQMSLSIEGSVKG